MYTGQGPLTDLRWARPDSNIYSVKSKTVPQKWKGNSMGSKRLCDTHVWSQLTLPSSLFTKVLMLVKILKFDQILKVSG